MKNVRIVWILALMLLVPFLAASCAKKTVKSSDTTQMSAEEKAAAEAERRRQAMLKEEELQDAEAQRKAAAERAKMAALEEFEIEDVYFEFDSSLLTPEGQRLLQKKAQYLRDTPGIKVVIEGHCDERGTNEYNLALGDRRAEAVKAYLRDLGISSARLTTVSYGEERPLDPRSTEDAWAKNRRAHFVIR
jgi:peptidoglycan-associated lipoprotein